MNNAARGAREELLDAALPFVQSVATLPGVQRIALIGSIVTDRPSPKDIDLLVTITEDTDLSPLAELAHRLQGRLLSFSLGADVFLASERGKYLGRTCPWEVCRPGARASCEAMHCGSRPYLHDDPRTIQLSDAQLKMPPVELWPKAVRRVELPGDVEAFMTRLDEPHNDTLHLSAVVGLGADFVRRLPRRT